MTLGPAERLASPCHMTILGRTRQNKGEDIAKYVLYRVRRWPTRVRRTGRLAASLRVVTGLVALQSGFMADLRRQAPCGARRSAAARLSGGMRNSRNAGREFARRVSSSTSLLKRACQKGRLDDPAGVPRLAKWIEDGGPVVTPALWQVAKGLIAFPRRGKVAPDHVLWAVLMLSDRPRRPPLWHGHAAAGSGWRRCCSDWHCEPTASGQPVV